MLVLATRPAMTFFTTSVPAQASVVSIGSANDREQNQKKLIYLVNGCHNCINLKWETCFCSWISVKAAFILSSRDWQFGGLYMSLLPSMRTSDTKDRFQSGDFQKTLPVAPAVFALESERRKNRPLLYCWQPASWIYQCYLEEMISTKHSMMWCVASMPASWPL